jgi:hypothetical protein
MVAAPGKISPPLTHQNRRAGGEAADQPAASLTVKIQRYCWITDSLAVLPPPQLLPCIRNACCRKSVVGLLVKGGFCWGTVVSMQQCAEEWVLETRDPLAPACT